MRADVSYLYTLFFDLISEYNITKENTEGLVSSLELAEELGKIHGNLRSLIKRWVIKKPKEYTYTERKKRMETNTGYPRTVSVFYITPSMAEDIRNLSGWVRWSKERVNKWCEDNKKPFKLKSKVFTNIEDYEMEWQCLLHKEHTWRTCFTGIKHKGTGCHPCSKYRLWSYEDIVDEVKLKHTDKLLLTKKEDYIDIRTPLLWKCLIDGYEWPSTWTKINIQKTRCHLCTGNVQWTIPLIKKKVSTDPTFKHITYLSGDYKNNKKSLLTWKCLHKECGYEWPVAWYNVNVKGTRCPICNKRGTYSKKNAEKYKNQWLKEPLTVYTLKCWNEETDEVFFKIGVTCRADTALRYSSHKTLPYKFSIIDEIRTNKYDGSYLERALFKKNRKYKYVPDKYFHGRTECYSNVIHIDLEKIDTSKLRVYSRKRK